METSARSAPLIDKQTFEREYRVCIRRYLFEGLTGADARRVVLRSEMLTARLGASLGARAALKIARDVLSSVADDLTQVNAVC